ncbi:hypothetical protein SAMN05443247_06640 [Bradyrhizobium erythrophlei]|nr:hypothetical protein SAMN05443247_06640 [Bradyrhizobium erythrophlei]
MMMRESRPLTAVSFFWMARMRPRSGSRGGRLLLLAAATFSK